MFSITPFLDGSAFTLALAGTVAFLFLLAIFSLRKTEYIIYGLLVWFPLETLILRVSSAEYYAFIKYFPEILIYGTLLISWRKYRLRTGRWFPTTPINKLLLLFVSTAIISLLLNFYNPAVWFLGIRQILRFVLIFIIFLFEDYEEKVVKNFLKIGIYVIVGESALAIIQAVSGGFLDKYLFFSESISLGPLEYGGVQQNWARGQRVFATLGRYDRLGSLLAIGLLMLFPWFYVLKKGEQREKWFIAFILGLVALVLTYSRASWLAFFGGMFTIGYFLLKDRRVFRIVTAGAAAILLYLIFLTVTQGFGSGTVDSTARQSLRDRFVEAVSVYSWQQSYEGYGRFFFIINTPLIVVSHNPLFGVGPGNYGGGVAAALDNRTVYNRLHLPFGIQNTYGQIDNNWLSIWGEFGTIGLVIWIMIFVEIFRSAYFVQSVSEDTVQKTVAQGLCGSVVGLAILGFFGPYFEFRALMVYFWLLVGIALYYFRGHKFSWNFLRD